ncbi:hypothetical protein [Streptacidiphilus albus]|uniref:hypothetical protein n=1 Tax=Streptacidiphilus albus TaxID=105425 RepID=UPI00054B0B07|nr:hypothetical protein [Streptacidiphilus albus]
MTSPSTHTLVLAAARNNADWCAAVSRSHGLPGAFGEAVWTSSDRTPPYYPDAVTLHPGAVPADFLPRIDTASPGCSVKDSFAALELTPDGFTELFSAQWIHRPAGVPVPATPRLRAEPVRSAGTLEAWQAAWHGEGEAPDVFRPALLADATVLVLAVHQGEALVGGAVLNSGAGLVGLSNLFATDDADEAEVRSCVLRAAAGHFPGLPVVGYEHGGALAAALDSGFSAIGPLRIWLHGG